MAEKLVEWKDEYSVGNQRIDEQHKGLLDFTNELYASCQRGGIIEQISFMRVVQEAVDYTRDHFATEEKLMQQVNYPEYDAHKKEHDAFVAEVMLQVKQLDNITTLKAEPFVIFLKDWVLNHIATSDKKYMPYIAEEK
jgi:hemerythrin